MVRHRTPVPGAYRFAANVLRPPLRLATRYSVTGLHHLPDDGGFIVTPNHLSYFDPFPWAHTLYDHGIAPVFLAKNELFQTPVIGRILRGAGQVPVHRESREAATALRDAVAALEEGRCVAIYPEGTLTRDPDLWPMRGKTGAARLALESRHPVLPVAQWGPQDVIPEYAHIPKLFPRKTIHIRFGPPVELDDLYEREPTMEVAMEATDRIMAAITRELEEIRGERAPAVRFDPKAHGMTVIGNFKNEDTRRKAAREGQR